MKGLRGDREKGCKKKKGGKEEKERASGKKRGSCSSRAVSEKN